MLNDKIKNHQHGNCRLAFSTAWYIGSISRRTNARFQSNEKDAHSSRHQAVGAHDKVRPKVLYEAAKEMGETKAVEFQESLKDTMIEAQEAGEKVREFFTQPVDKETELEILNHPSP